MTADPPVGHEPPDDSDDELDASDEALNWDGERDASHVAGPAPARSKQARSGKQPGPDRQRSASVATGSVETHDPDGAAPVPTSSFLLVTYGILGGVYALYTIGWITTILRNTISFPDLLSEIMYQLGEFLAIASAPVWFAAVFFFTRNSKPLVRLLWLLLGLILLVPVPFVLGV